MAPTVTHDLDYLTARLHARRSRMAEAKRLDDLCQQRTLSDLFSAVNYVESVPRIAAFQRWLLRELLREFAFCLRYLHGAEYDFIHWLRCRFQVENLKVLRRGFLNQLPADAVASHFVMLDDADRLDLPALLQSSNLEELSKRLPDSWLRSQWEAVTNRVPEAASGFAWESGLDAAYLRELFLRAERLAEPDKTGVVPLVEQRIEAFQLMLAVRGKFIHALSAEALWALWALRVVDAGPLAQRFRRLLKAPDLAALQEVAVAHSVDEWPVVRESASADALDFGDLERFTQNRLWRLANRAFRGSHTGFAAVAAYLELRQLEVANLITLSEGLRLGVESARLSSRLRAGPRQSQEAVHV